jgi:hypothetical protein
MSQAFKDFVKGIRLRDNDDTGIGDLSASLSASDNGSAYVYQQKLKIWLDNSEREVITNDQTQTITNKTIDADSNTISNLETDNLKAGVLVTDISTASADTELPSALAVKTALEGQNEASEIEYNPASNPETASTDVQGAVDDIGVSLDAHKSATSAHGTTGDVVGTSDSQTLTNKTIDADANSISNIDNADIKAGAAIDRSKIASGTANRVIVNDGSGNLSESTVTQSELEAFAGDIDGKIPTFSSTNDNRLVKTDGTSGDAIQESGISIDDSDNMTGIASAVVGTIDINGSSVSTTAANLVLSGSNGLVTTSGRAEITNSLSLGQEDSNITGDDADVVATGSSFIKLQQATLNSISGAQNVADGQVLILSNNTGGAVTIKNDNAASAAARRILTGTGSNLTLEDDASILLAYDSDVSRWRIVGGSGSGSGGSGEAIQSEVSQASHGFSALDAIYHNGTSWVAAQADDEATVATHVVSSVLDVNTFTATQAGIITVSSHGLTLGSTYYTSESSAGDITATEPAAGAGNFSNPVLIPITTDDLIVLNHRAKPVDTQDALVDLTDVNTSSLVEGEVLAYDELASEWVNTKISGSINYIKNSSFEANVNGWSTYADAAANKPVDGQDGSPNVTFTRTTTASEVLRGTASGKFSKDAANRQGEGVAVDAEVFGNADLSSVMYCKFDYDASAANYADGDLRVYIISSEDAFVSDYNVIEPANVELQGGKGTHFCTFQSDASDVDYRVCLHVASMNTAAYDVFIKDVKVGPLSDISQPTSAAISDMKSWTPNISGGGSLAFTTEFAKYHREGQFAFFQLNIEVTSGGSGTSPVLVDISDVGIIDSDAFESTSSVQRVISGGSFRNENQTGPEERLAVGLRHVESDGGQYLRIFPNVGSGNNLSATVDVDGGDISTGDEINIWFKVPIKGWSSGGDTDVAVVDASRPVFASAYLSGNQTVSSGSTDDVEFDTTLEDTHASFNTSTYTYTFPVSGIYEIEVDMRLVVAGTANSNNLSYVKNGSTTIHTVRQPAKSDVSQFQQNSSYKGSFNKGDTLKFTMQNGTTGGDTTISAGDTITKVYINKISNPSNVISPDEKVFMRATKASNQVLTDDTETLVTWDNPATGDDSHGSFSSNQFTANTTGRFNVKAQFITGSSTWTSGDFVSIRIYKNSTLYTEFQHRVAATFTNFIMVSVDDEVNLNKGETVEIRARIDRGADTAILGSSTSNIFNVKKL